MARPGTVRGWLLSDRDRNHLLSRFRPRYQRTVAHHVTLDVGAAANGDLPPQVSARVVGQADDGISLECLVVEIDGTTARPDGSTFHITWSLGAGRQARQSNDVLRSQEWKPLPAPIPIELAPARL